MSKNRTVLNLANSNSGYAAVEFKFAGRRVTNSGPLEYTIDDINEEGYIDLPTDNDAVVKLLLGNISTITTVEDFKRQVERWDEWRTATFNSTPIELDERWSESSRTTVLHEFARIISLRTADLQQGSELTQEEVYHRLGGRLDLVSFVVNKDSAGSIEDVYIVDVNSNEVLYRGYHHGVTEHELPRGWQCLTGINQAEKFPDWETYQNDYLANK